MSNRITDAEFEVMKVLWAESPLGAAEIVERISTKPHWTAKTVKTLINRLSEKGVLAHKPDGRRFLYRPLIKEEDFARDATESLADKLFNGRAAPLVAHLADGRGLTKDDITELESLIAELKHERD